MLPRYYEFSCPVKIMSGEQALDNIPYELKDLGVSRSLIITDKGVVAAGLLSHVQGCFADSGCVIAGVFDQVPPDSSVDTLKAAALMYMENSCDSLIAVGGGSVIDTAKGVNILISEGVNDISERSGVDRLTAEMRPLIVVPTTSGTGSEVTCVAVIADHTRGIKLLFASRRIMPHIAVLDPRMTLTLPPHITAATGMDALTHAIEAYICLQKNPMSDAYAHSAITLIREHLIHAVKNGRDSAARSALANASCMAGIAFSNSMVGMVHGLGHALGAVCRIPHGTAMSIFLPHGMEYNIAKAEKYLAELLLPLAGADVYSSTMPQDRARASINAVLGIRDRLHQICQLPRSLSEAGVDKAVLPEIARKAMGDGSLILNPEESSYDDILAVLEKAY